MKQYSHSKRLKERREMLLKSLELTKQLTPNQRYDAFLELQEAMIETYFQGLRARNPELTHSELLVVAKKEQMGNVS